MLLILRACKSMPSFRILHFQQKGIALSSDSFSIFRLTIGICSAIRLRLQPADLMGVRLFINLKHNYCLFFDCLFEL